MIVDLVHTITRDGVRLDGVFRAPQGTATVAIDALLCLHGAGGNFYSSTLFDHLADRLLTLGCGVLRVNTRGHDGISNAVTADGGRRLGAAYEVVDDCRHDIAAWVDWLRQQGCKQVGLIGHSLGAVKALYAAAHDPELRPACVIAVSPPRLSYSWFCAGPQRAEFLDTFAAAEQHLAAGRPTALLEVTLPMAFVITAAGYVEKYGPEERYNVLRFLAGVRCPTLLTLGAVEVEKNTAFRGTPEAVRELRPRLVAVEVIPAADHFYTGVRDDLAGRIEGWVRANLPRAGQ